MTSGSGRYGRRKRTNWAKTKGVQKGADHFPSVSKCKTTRAGGHANNITDSSNHRPHGTYIYDDTRNIDFQADLPIFLIRGAVAQKKKKKKKKKREKKRKKKGALKAGNLNLILHSHTKLPEAFSASLAEASQVRTGNVSQSEAPREESEAPREAS